MTGVETDALHYFSPPTIRPEEIDGRRKSLCGHVVQKAYQLGPGWANQESLPKGESRKISLELSQFVSRGLSKHHGTGGQVCQEKQVSCVAWMEYEC